MRQLKTRNETTENNCSYDKMCCLHTAYHTCVHCVGAHTAHTHMFRCGLMSQMTFQNFKMEIKNLKVFSFACFGFVLPFDNITPGQQFFIVHWKLSDYEDDNNWCVYSCHFYLKTMYPSDLAKSRWPKNAHLVLFRVIFLPFQILNPIKSVLLYTFGRHTRVSHSWK